jgi:hypothetical protein
MPRSSPNGLRLQFPIQLCPSTEIGMGVLSRLSALFWRSARSWDEAWLQGVVILVVGGIACLQAEEYLSQYSHRERRLT